jgi:hypothetical protein
LLALIVVQVSVLRVFQLHIGIPNSKGWNFVF